MKLTRVSEVKKIRWAWDKTVLPPFLIHYLQGEDLLKKVAGELICAPSHICPSFITLTDNFLSFFLCCESDE